MTETVERGTPPSVQDVALIIGGGPGISSSCARLFAKNGMRVAVAARNPDKPVLQNLEKDHGVRRYACDASDPAAVASLFQNVVRDLGTPTLLVHNIDGRVPGIFGKKITEAEPGMVFDTIRNSAFSAFLVGQQAARLMRDNTPNTNGARGTIIFTNASAALKGFPASGAFAMACHAKAGLAESMARELMPQGIHVAKFRSTPRSASLRTTAPARTDGRGRLSTTTWPTRTVSPKPICSCIGSTGRLGRSRSCCGHGSRSGDRASPARRTPHARFVARPPAVAVSGFAKATPDIRHPKALSTEALAKADSALAVSVSRELALRSKR